MTDRQIVVYRGFTVGHVLVAALAGAAAGAAAAYLGNPEARARLRGAVDDNRARLQRMPEALQKATEAARDAFNKAIEEEVAH